MDPGEWSPSSPAIEAIGNRAQTIREVETWAGGDGKVELSSGYDQAWSRGDGTYILSNSPGFDPRTVLQDQQWTELKRSKP